jgi:hypothetical protein
MRGIPIQSKIMVVLGDRQARTAPAIAQALEIGDDQAQKALEILFVGSKVECARRPGGNLYRLPPGTA